MYFLRINEVYLSSYFFVIIREVLRTAPAVTKWFHAQLLITLITQITRRSLGDFDTLACSTDSPVARLAHYVISELSVACYREIR